MKFSFKFSLAVTTATINHITAGIPTLEDITKQSKDLITGEEGTNEEIDMSSYKKNKPSIETLPNDSRLWNEVFRNLSKDVNRHSVISITDNSFSSIRNFRQRNIGLKDKDMPTARKDSIIAFSCGHAFSEIQFQENVLIEFIERIRDCLTLMPQMLTFLQQYYKQCTSFTSGCPYCVFQYLRMAELKKDPTTPIRPWNYY